MKSCQGLRFLAENERSRTHQRVGERLSRVFDIRAVPIKTIALAGLDATGPGQNLQITILFVQQSSRLFLFESYEFVVHGCGTLG